MQNYKRRNSSRYLRASHLEVGDFLRRSVKTLSLTTLLTITGCTSSKETSIASVTTSVDTTNPVITLVSKSVTVEKDTKYSAKDNIKSVTDDTDGTLEYVKKATEGSAYYLIDDSKIDTSKAGTYKVVVTAFDKSGNTATKDFNVVVKEAEKKESSKKSDSTKSDSTKSTTKSDSNTSSSKTSSSSNSSDSGNSSSNANASQSASSNNSNTQTAQTCKTVHHDATGHYEQKLKTAAWDESVYEGVKIKCNACGETFSGSSEYLAHTNYYRDLWNAQYEQTGDPEKTDKSLLAHGSSTDVPVYSYIHHDAEYESVWVEDTAAYDETVCS